MKNLLTTKSRNTNVYYKVLQRFSKICGATYIKDRRLSMQEGGRKVYKKGVYEVVLAYINGPLNILKTFATKYFFNLFPIFIFSNLI